MSHFASSLFLLLAASSAFAHPGHFDNSPIAHEAAHSIPYFLLSIAIGVLAVQRLARRLRARNERNRF